MTGDGPRPLANNRGKRSIPSGGVYDARHFVSRLSLNVGLERPFPISSPSPSLDLSHRRNSRNGHLKHIQTLRLAEVWRGSSVRHGSGTAVVEF